MQSKWKEYRQCIITEQLATLQAFLVRKKIEKCVCLCVRACVLVPVCVCMCVFSHSYCVCMKESKPLPLSLISTISGYQNCQEVTDHCKRTGAVGFEMCYRANTPSSNWVSVLLPGSVYCHTHTQKAMHFNRFFIDWPTTAETLTDKTLRRLENTLCSVCTSSFPGQRLEGQVLTGVVGVQHMVYSRML